MNKDFNPEELNKKFQEIRSKISKEEITDWLNAAEERERLEKIENDRKRFMASLEGLDGKPYVDIKYAIKMLIVTKNNEL